MEAPLRNLQHLRFGLGKGSPAEFCSLCDALTGLTSLSLQIDSDWRSCTDRSLFQHLPKLTRLSALRLAGATNAEGRMHCPVPATFLTGLTGLAELTLCYVLSEHNAAADIPCLAVLTRLTWLVVRSRYPWDGRGGCRRSRRVPECSVVHQSSLQPLRALRLLQVWDLNMAWHTQRSSGVHVDSPDEVIRGMCICPEYPPVQARHCFKWGPFGRLCYWTDGLQLSWRGR